jgi:hypothetical protein
MRIMTYQAPHLILIGEAHNLVLLKIPGREGPDNSAGLLRSRDIPTL